MLRRIRMRVRGVTGVGRPVVRRHGVRRRILERRRSRRRRRRRRVRVGHSHIAMMLTQWW